MNKIAIMAAILLLTTINIFATEQIPDLLIIGKDTFYLKSFPLENLRLKEKFKESPFEYYENIDFPSTGCYRGYVATWKVIDNKLLLIEIEKVDSTNQKLDIDDYLKKNGYNPKLISGYVFADWYSDTLKRYDYFMYYFNQERFYLAIDYLRNIDNKTELIFDEGILTCNNIMSIDSYLLADTLTKEISFYRQWFLKRGLTKVDAVIKENNGKMVRVEIVDYGTTKKSAQSKINQLMGIRDEQEYWINPRYWNRKININAL